MVIYKQNTMLGNLNQLGHLTHKIVSEITYNVPYSNSFLVVVLSQCWLCVSKVK